MKPESRRALNSALSRRTVLRGAGLATVGIAVGACTGPNESNPRLPDEHAQATVAKSAVPVGSGVIVDQFVITQPTEGSFAAYSSICPHQGCPVNGIAGDTITCGCHGSTFSTLDGSATQGPATKGLAEATVTEDGDQLHISN